MLAEHQDFLKNCGLADCEVIPLASDASSRRYFKIAGSDYLLMQAPPDEHDLQAFISIAEHLRKIGIASPKIYAEDKTHGLLLLQDFGDKNFSHLLAQKTPADALYRAAIEVLIHLQTHKDNAKINLPLYDNKKLCSEAELFHQWYLKKYLPQSTNGKFASEFQTCIFQALEKLPPLPNCLVLRDYHIDNLMEIDGFKIGKDSPLQACGVLDFQDALIGSPAYDVMSILEDARIDVPADLQKSLYNKYLQQVGLPPDDFALHYTALACIRHLKVLGIFTRLNVRDNKPQYLHHIPHVKNLLKVHLQNELWVDLQKLLTDSIADF